MSWVVYAIRLSLSVHSFDPGNVYGSVFDAFVIFIAGELMILSVNIKMKNGEAGKYLAIFPTILAIGAVVFVVFDIIVALVK